MAAYIRFNSLLIAGPGSSFEAFSLLWSLHPAANHRLFGGDWAWLRELFSIADAVAPLRENFPRENQPAWTAVRRPRQRNACRYRQNRYSAPASSPGTESGRPD